MVELSLPFTSLNIHYIITIIINIIIKGIIIVTIAYLYFNMALSSFRWCTEITYVSAQRTPSACVLHWRQNRTQKFHLYATHFSHSLGLTWFIFRFFSLRFVSFSFLVFFACARSLPIRFGCLCLPAHFYVCNVNAVVSFFSFVISHDDNNSNSSNNNKTKPKKHTLDEKYLETEQTLSHAAHNSNKPNKKVYRHTQTHSHTQTTTKFVAITI